MRYQLNGMIIDNKKRDYLLLENPLLGHNISETFINNKSTLNIYGTNIPTHTDHDKYKYLLKIFHDFAIKYDIKYFIAYGTLLGQIRNQDFIPYDYDIDVVIEKDSISKLFKLLDNNNSTITMILNKDLKKTPLTNKNSPKLILNSSHPQEGEGHRYTCKGDVVSSPTDGCSFQSLIGRLVYIDTTGKNFYLDLFGYFNFKNHYGDSIDTVNFNFPIVPCKLAGIDTFRPSDNISKQILKNDYGENYLKPDHIYNVKNKKWIKINNI